MCYIGASYETHAIISMVTTSGINNFSNVINNPLGNGKDKHSHKNVKYNPIGRTITRYYTVTWCVSTSSLSFTTVIMEILSFTTESDPNYIKTRGR